MYKVLEHLRNHPDAWAFLDPVEESIAPNYYAVIRRPMHITKVRDKERKADNFRYIDEGGWVYHLFVYISWSCRLVALMLCYKSIAPSTCKEYISARAICPL